MDEPIYSIQNLSPDSPHLVTIAKWYFDEWGEEGTVSENLSWINGLIVSNDEAIFVAESAGQAVGAIVMVKCDHEGYRQFTPWVAGLYIAKSHRRFGLASRLLDTCKTWARRKRIPEIYLYADEGFRTEFYARRGFEKIDRYEKAGTVFQVMKHRLTSDRPRSR